MLLTPKELAQRLKVTDGTLRKWRVFGSGPKFIKLGEGSKAPVRYRIEDVEAFERSGREAP